VIFRHVEFDRNDKMVDNLECFLKEAIGRQYGMNLGKMLRRHTVASGMGSKNDD